MRTTHAMRRRITGAVAGLLIAGSAVLTVAGSAQAAPVPGGQATTAQPAQPAQPAQAAAEPQGRVVSRLTLAIRQKPTAQSTYLGGIQPGAVVYLHCKVRGENVDGNNLWYQLGNGRPGYVAARYVQNLSAVPWC